MVRLSASPSFFLGVRKKFPRPNPFLFCLDSLAQTNSKFQHSTPSAFCWSLRPSMLRTNV
ncbi:hypothetical protein K438DRAFT_274064 [Mycena galopus ATCC 62051]|nr:hypothetical protein K438DRAFT_274064 [Mycena galopus ATCC 62051]